MYSLIPVQFYRAFEILKLLLVSEITFLGFAKGPVAVSVNRVLRDFKGTSLIYYDPPITQLRFQKCLLVQK